MTAAGFDWLMPVMVTFGAGSADRLGDLLGEREALVLAFPPARTLGFAVRWRAALGARLVDWIEVPDGLSSIACARAVAARAWPQLAARTRCTIVAVGGGSTLDIAKLVRCRPRDGNFEAIVATLRGAAAWPALDLAPLWLVPTTAGTGSEVTRWATVWDTEAYPQVKRSLDEPFGYAERAIVDPALTLTCPSIVTRDTALDTLAHALEAIWNRHANPLCNVLALSAARRVLATLPACLERPDDVGLRGELSLAALEAGCAFSQTRTALAHALSYAVTLELGVPHGQACALWLPTAWRLAVGHDAGVDRLLAQVFNDTDGATLLEDWLAGVGMEARPEAYGIVDAPVRVAAALGSARGRNFIGATEVSA